MLKRLADSEALVGLLMYSAVNFDVGSGLYARFGLVESMVSGCFGSNPRIQKDPDSGGGRRRNPLRLKRRDSYLKAGQPAMPSSAHLLADLFTSPLPRRTPESTLANLNNLPYLSIAV